MAYFAWAKFLRQCLSFLLADDCSGQKQLVDEGSAVYEPGLIMHLDRWNLKDVMVSID